MLKPLGKVCRFSTDHGGFSRISGPVKRVRDGAIESRKHRFRQNSSLGRVRATPAHAAPFQPCIGHLFRANKKNDPLTPLPAPAGAVRPRRFAACRVRRDARHRVRRHQNARVLLGRQPGRLRFRAVHDQHRLRRRRARCLRYARRVQTWLARSRARTRREVGRIRRRQDLHVPFATRRQVPVDRVFHADARLQRRRRRVHVQAHDRSGQSSSRRRIRSAFRT